MRLSNLNARRGKSARYIDHGDQTYGVRVVLLIFEGHVPRERIWSQDQRSALQHPGFSLRESTLLASKAEAERSQRPRDCRSE